MLQLLAAPAETVQVDQEKFLAAPLKPRRLQAADLQASLSLTAIRVPSSDVHSSALGASLTITSHSPPDRDG